jgi:hypothetical protein
MVGLSFAETINGEKSKLLTARSGVQGPNHVSKKMARDGQLSWLSRL